MGFSSRNLVDKNSWPTEATTIFLRHQRVYQYSRSRGFKCSCWMQPLAYRVLPEQEECRRSAARAGTANVVVTTEYATEGPDTNQTAPLAVACASRVAVQPYSVRATPGQCGQAMTYSATSDQSWPNNGRKQSQLGTYVLKSLPFPSSFHSLFFYYLNFIPSDKLFSVFIPPLPSKTSRIFL